MSEQEQHEHHSHPSGYEKKDTNIKVLVGVAAATVILIVFFAVVLNEYFLITKERLVYEQQLAPESMTLKELRAREDSVLTTYGPGDTATGTYRIPLDTAITKFVEEANE